MRGLLILLVVVFIVNCVEGRVRSNTQIARPLNHSFADLTADKISDFIVTDGDKVYIASTEFTVHGYAYTKVPGIIKYVITGTFNVANKEGVCFTYSSGTNYGKIDCYGMSPDNKYLWWAFTQSDFVGNSHAIVGDFDGNGYDDILVYAPATGYFNVYTIQSTGFFGLMSTWKAADATGLLNHQIRAGNFDGDSRTDIIAWAPGTRAFKLLVTQNCRNGPSTALKHCPKLWWTTVSNFATATEEVAVPNLDGDAYDDIVFHDVNTGAWRVFDASFNYGLKTLFPQTTGPLEALTYTNMYWAKMKNVPSEAGNSDNRDDLMLFAYQINFWYRYDARWDSTALNRTYWWAYTNYALLLNVDTDGDAILTKHELGGYDANNDGVSDTPLHHYGASPFYKDIFVEVDYMVAGPGETESHIFKPAAVNIAVAAMAEKSINLHVFVDTALAYSANMGNPFDWALHFDPIKNANFPVARRPFFHYCIFGSRYGATTSSGLSRGIVASDFIVTLGGWSSNPGTDQQQAGTFLHELGHNLGLLHGGTDSVNNKANFLSIMNYNYQTGGMFKNGAYRFYYSDLTCSNMNELAVNENNGVQCSVASGNTYWSYISPKAYWYLVNTAIDFNGDTVYSASIAYDTNSDGLQNTVIGGPNEYSKLVFKGGSVGSAAGQTMRARVQPEDMEPELTEDDVETIAHPPDFHGPRDVDEAKEPHNGIQYLWSSSNVPEGWTDPLRM